MVAQLLKTRRVPDLAELLVTGGLSSWLSHLGILPVLYCLGAMSAAGALMALRLPAIERD